MYTIQKKTVARLVTTGMAVALLASPISSVLPGPGNVAAAASAVDKSSHNLKPIWTKTLGDPSKINPQTTLIKNNLYYTVGKKYIAFDALAGKTRWTYPAAAVSQTVTDGQSVWFRDATGRLIKLNAATGKLQWKVKTQSQPGKKESYVNHSLHAADGVIYVGDAYGLTAYNASSGKVKWKLKGSAHGYKLLQTGKILVATTIIDGALTTSGLQGIDAKNGKVKWTQTDGDHQDILFSNDKSFYTRDVTEGIDAGYAANIDEISLETGKLIATRSYIPVDFVEDQSASDVVSDGEYFYVIEKYDETQKKAVVSRFPTDSRSKADPDKTYAFEAGVAEWSLGDAGLAYVRLDNGKLLTLDTNSGRTLASAQYKGAPLPTLIGQNVLVVQHGGQISGVKKAAASQ
ncbi:outer membrane protein assembly factor BamB family protein [Paenibacillus lautus]|uniref:outer membrane protein assembly factor BamB family protein n=1 Tax=Paenibacillus lautus TaxID=1401 RepID=UPI001C0F8D34|nr:PQQ-binding-like beta-propeller repeat protein [Paenibacillus lautus]MBU5344718.1 PQQ-binding-like beta-propeller repeat protein [Paenibacillus lautus]